MSTSHIAQLKQIVDLPTAPFVEDYVAAFIRDFVAQRKQLRIRKDAFGNLLVKYTPKQKTKATGRPILFAAHMDHPGFIAGKMIDATHVHAEWHGGVQSRYFKGEKLRFYLEGRWIPATIEKVIPQKLPKSDNRKPGDVSPKAVIAKVKERIPPGTLGMWNIKDAVVRGHHIHARVTDDLSGLAAIICMLQEICQKDIKCPCYAFFTRAEEVGFAGALAAVDGKTVPQNTVVVAVENSAVITGVEMGDGPVLRVGDRASVFNPAATEYCRLVADQLMKKDKSFKYQRKLMDGGSCESTAYCHYGYDATGICLPLLNYHNMDSAKGKIGPECNDTRDFLNLVKWFVALAAAPAKTPFQTKQAVLGKKLNALLTEHRSRLMKTAK